MISSQLPKEFSSWYPLDNDCIMDAPQKSGIYVIRMSGGKCFGRLQGETDIVYIGSTKQLKRRFYQFLHPGPTQWTNQRINQLLKKYSFEIAWLENDNPKIPEHNLLRQFLAEHDEFPPLNRADIRKMGIKILQQVHVLPSMDKEVKTNG